MSRRAIRLTLWALALPTAGTLAALGAKARDTRPCLPQLVTSPVGDSALASARTGRLLVASQSSATASVVDLATGKVTQVGAGIEPHDAAISPDGRWGVVSDFGERSEAGFTGHRLTVVAMASGRVVRTIDTGELRGLHDLAFRPGAPTRVLVTAQTSRRLLEVDVVTGAIVAAIDTHGERSHLVAVTDDGRTAFTTNEGSATVSRIDLETGAFVTTFPAWQNVEGVAVTADGSELWVGSSAKGAVFVLDATTGRVLTTIPGFRYPDRIVMTPDRRRVVISDYGCRALIVADPATRRVVRVMPTAEPAVFVGDFSPDGRVAFAALEDDRAVAAIDLESGAEVARHQVGRAPDGVSWGPAVDR